ncbi:MAG: hypothetical protein KC457_00670 [Myxococcales bacterium]|nr:hypothetical protein [Myxococcales bacterium]
MSRAVSLSSLLLSCLLCACPAPEDGDDDAAADDTTETGVEGQVEAHLLECADAVCGLVSYQYYAPPNEPSLPSTETLQCVIDALDARAPAVIVVSSGCEGSCVGDIFLIRSDGTALRQSWNADFGDVPVTLPGDYQALVSDWPEGGRLCDIAPVGSCTPESCDSPSDWFVNCRVSEDNACEA